MAMGGDWEPEWGERAPEGENGRKGANEITKGNSESNKLLQ